MASKVSQLQVAIEASCRRAWEGWSKKNPDERFYAFALYTTMDADYFVPSASGENGLAKVARQYIKRKSFATIDEAKSQLRWSLADSPYHTQGERYNKGVDEELDAAPIPYDKSERVADKVIKARLDTAVAALQSLDRQGIFGKGAQRRKIILLVEAGDRDQEWALKLAKRLNTKNVYSTYAKQFQPRIIGKFKELGSKLFKSRISETSGGGEMATITYGRCLSLAAKIARSFKTPNGCAVMFARSMAIRGQAMELIGRDWQDIRYLDAMLTEPSPIIPA
jgi:hypothetical protein